MKATRSDGPGPAARRIPAGLESAPVGRRGFLGMAAAAVGGGAFLPLLPMLRESGWRGGGKAAPESAAPGGVVEIAMRSDPIGAHVWFEPNGVALGCGDTVRWVNESGVHTVTAYHPTNGRPLRMPAGAEPWDSGYLIEPGSVFEVTPEVDGVYDFFCRPHEAAGMVGRLVVLPPGTLGQQSLPKPVYPSRSPTGHLPEAATRGFPTVREILARPSAVRPTRIARRV